MVSEIINDSKCEEHPSFNAKFKPKNDCLECFMLHTRFKFKARLTAGNKGKKIGGYGGLRGKCSVCSKDNVVISDTMVLSDNRKICEWCEDNWNHIDTYASSIGAIRGEMERYGVGLKKGLVEYGEGS